MKKTAARKSVMEKRPSKRAAAVGTGVGMTEVRASAKSLGVPSFGKSKRELIRAIQRAEGNFDCYGTAFSGFCDQEGCRWHAECLADSLNSAP
jgi:hypothetical protein